MAKKKATPAKPEMTVISVKTTVAFREWASGVADAERITTVQLIEKSLVEYAERRKIGGPAPKRTEGR